MSDNEEQLTRTSKDEENERSHKKLIITVSILLFVIALIGLIVYYFVSQNNSNGQIDDFEAAVKNRNYSELSTMLSTNNKTINETDAERFVNYINTDNNKQNFEQDIKEIRKSINSDKQYDSEIGEIKDKNEKTIVKVVRNGKRFFFIDKIDFEPQLFDVYVKEGNNNADYRYQNSNNKEQNITAIKNKTTKLGEFFVGEYDVDATKDFEEKKSLVEGSVDGSLHIDTDTLGDNKRIIAKDNFEQAWFKINLKNTDELDKVKKIYVEDKEADYKKDTIYGKYPAESPIEVHAIGKIDDEKIKTKPVEIESNKNQSIQTIDLTFDQKAIDKHIKKNKKVEDKAKEYMNDYTEDLNKAYKVSSFRYVKKYFEKDSDLGNHIKGQVESKKKSKYSDVNISSSKKDGNKVNVILSKKNKDKDKIQSQYVLNYDEDKEDFIIKEYTDI